MKLKNMIRNVVIVISFALLVSGRQTPPPPKQSGIFPPWEGFRSGPTDGIDKIWLSPGINSVDHLLTILPSYEQIIVDPVLMSPNQKTYINIDPADLAKR